MNRLLLIALFNMCAVTALGDDPLSNQDLWFRCDAAAVDEFTKEITPSMVVVFDNDRVRRKELVGERYTYGLSFLVFTARDDKLCLWLIDSSQRGKASVSVNYRSSNTEVKIARLRYVQLESWMRNGGGDVRRLGLPDYSAASYRFFDVEEVLKLLSGDWIIFEFKENGKQLKFPLTGTFQGPYGEEQLRDALKKNIVQLVQEKGIVHKWDALSISGPIDPATGEIDAAIKEALDGLRKYNMKKVKAK